MKWFIMWLIPKELCLNALACGYSWWYAYVLCVMHMKRVWKGNEIVSSYFKCKMMRKEWWVELVLLFKLKKVNAMESNEMHMKVRKFGNGLKFYKIPWC